MVCCRLVVSGRVQGVFYRRHCKEKVYELGGISGFIRNLDNGTVEIVMEGPEERVKQLIDWCHKGPPAADVQDIKIEKVDNHECKKEKFEGFVVRM